MNCWRWLEMRMPVLDFEAELWPPALFTLWGSWPARAAFATLTVPCELEGRSWGTDLPRVFVRGFACLNLALLAMPPPTGYVWIRPRKPPCLAALFALLTALAWAAAAEFPFFTMKSEESL